MMTRPPKDWKKKTKIQIECTVNLLAVRLELFFKNVCEEFVFQKVVHLMAFLGSVNPFFQILVCQKKREKIEHVVTAQCLNVGYFLMKEMLLLYFFYVFKLFLYRI